MTLSKLNVGEYADTPGDTVAPYFLVNQDIYQKADIRFPFRTVAYGLGITYSGGREHFKIGSMDYYPQAGSLITIGPGIVCQWLGGHDALHDTIYFSEDLFRDSIRASFLHSFACFRPGGNHVIAVTESEQRTFALLFQSLRELIGERELVPGIVYSLLMLVKKCHERAGFHTRPLNRKEKIVLGFKKLMQECCGTHREVAFYAARLNISPKYLSEVLRAETGKPAKLLIQEYILLEAKSLLRQTNMTVQEICHALGYEDSSNFSKAFKRQEGITPLAYRKL